MKILPNIPSAIKLYSALRYLNKEKKNIETAKAAGDYEKERIHIQAAEHIWSNKLMETFNVEVVVHGEENLPDEGPVVYVPNHQGYADIIACCAVLSKKIQFGYIAKDDLEKVPLYGNWIKRIRSVLIKRNDPRASLRAIEEGIDLINKGFSMLIFPEGTRSKGPEMADFKRGALKLATKPGVPVVPVSLHGTYRMFEETGVIKGTRIDIMIHPPMETKDLTKPQEKQFVVELEKIVRDGLEELIKIQEEANA